MSINLQKKREENREQRGRPDRETERERERESERVDTAMLWAACCCFGLSKLAVD